MTIRPLGDSYAPRRPVRALEAPAVVDAVHLEGRAPGALRVDLARAGALQAATSTPLGAASPSLAEVTRTIQDLEQQGIRFERCRNILGWHTSWKPVEADGAAELALKGKRDRLSALVPGRDRLPVRSAGDVEELAVLEGGRKGQLPEPRVQEAVAALAKAGGEFQAEEGRVGPYGAYNAMTGDGFTGLTLTLQGTTVDLHSADDLYFAAFLHDPTRGPDLLARPDLARSLREVESRGLELSTGGTGETYRLLRDGGKPPEDPREPGRVHVQRGTVTLDAVTPEELGRPAELAARLDRLKAERDELERLEPHKADVIWPVLRRRPADRPLADRAAAALALGADEARYDGLLALLPATEALAPAAVQLAALVKQFPQRPPEWHLQALENLRQRQAPEQAAYLRLLETVGDPALAGQAEVLARGTQAPQRGEAIARLAQAAREPALGVAMAAELGDRLCQDAPALAEALRECAGEAAEPLAAWKAARSLGADLDVGLLRASRAMHEGEPPEARLKGFVTLLEANSTPEARAAMGELVRVALSARWSGDWKNVDGEWMDSPGAHYKNNDKLVLTSGPLSLERLTRPVIRFEARHDLEEGCDRVYLEASVDGQDWRSLATYTGSSRWKGQEVSLGGFEGRQVRLRFRLSADGSNTGEGFSFRGFRVEGVPVGEDRPVTVFDESPGAGGRRLGEVLRPVEAEPDPARRQDLLVAAGRLVQRLGSTREAAQLLPLVAASPNRQEAAEALARVASRTSASAAVAMWQVVTGDLAGPLSERVDRLLDLEGTARCLAGADAHRAEVLAPVWTRLVRLGLDSATTQVFREMAARLAPWEAEGGWAQTLEPGRGAVWTDSPDGNYRDNANAVLTSQPLSLRHHTGARLGFQARHALEEGCDHCRVEVSADGRDWTQVAAFTGNASWKRHEVDLSAWDGKTVRVRFRFTTDGSNVADGFTFQDFRVDARPAWQPDGAPATLYTGDGPSGLEQLVQTLEKCPPTRRQATARALARTATACGSASGALELWPALEPRFGRPDFEKQRDALTRLAAALGSEPALEIWRRLEQTPDPSSRVEEALDAFQLGRLRAGRDALSYDLSAVVDVWSRLLDTPLTREGWKALADLATEVQPWIADGGWGLLPGPEEQPVWTDSPQGPYRNNVDSSITTPVLSLENVSGARATFEASWALEEGCDFVHLEASTDGREWKKVKTFAASSAWKPQEVDLSDFDGSRVRLRLRLHTDGSNTADGFRMKGFQVTGTPRYDASAPRVPVFADTPSAFRALLDRLLAATAPARDAADRTRRVQALAATARELKSIEAALDLWPTLAPELDTPAFEARRQGLSRLAREMGPGLALRAWPEVQDPESAVHLFRLARTLVVAGQPKAGPDAIFDRWRELRGYDLSSKGWEGLSRVAGSLAPFQGEGKWARVQDPKRGALYSDSPAGPYGVNENRSLRSHRLSLEGIDKPTLRFSLRHDLEPDCDFVHLEASRDGQEWEKLRRFEGSADWHEQSVDLSAWSGGSLEIRVRLQSDGSNNQDGVELTPPVVEGRDPRTGAPVRRTFDEAAAGSVSMLLAAARAPHLSREERSRFLEFLSRLQPAQSCRVLDFLGRHAGGDQAAALGRLISRVTTALVVSDDVDQALESALRAQEEATIRPGEQEVAIGGVRLPVQGSA